MKAGERLLVTFAPWLGSLLIRLLYHTIRIERLGQEQPQQFWDQNENVILACWHDELLMMGRCYNGPEVNLLISASKDGELIARTMRFFGHGSVRGSSSRGGKAAFRELLRLSKGKADLALTPDGPRGPRHQLKEGVVQLARLSGRPVVPIGFACSRGHRFASWDRFLLPCPLSRGVFSYGPAVAYRKGESPEEFRQRLHEAMTENQRQARERLEAYGLSAV